MTITLYAQPYDISATGFYFSDAEAYRVEAAELRNSYGDRIEEFEIQFIDGSRLDCAFAEAFGLNQVNFAPFIDAAETWADDQKINFILAVGECGYNFDPAALDPDAFEIELYRLRSLKQLAEQFVEDGLYGEIPDSLQYYIDYDAIARDLAADYTETVIAGEWYLYRIN